MPKAGNRDGRPRGADQDRPGCQRDALIKFPNVFTVSAQMCIFLGSLRPNDYIYVQMIIFGRYRNWFLWVIRGLQAVGSQIRTVGPRKWLGSSILHICDIFIGNDAVALTQNISVLQIHVRFSNDKCIRCTDSSLSLF